MNAPRFVASETYRKDALLDHTDPDYAIDQRVIVSRDGQSLPAILGIALMVGQKSNRQTIVIKLTMDFGMGLHHELTTAAARRAAAAIIAEADKIDAQAATEAAAVIAKAAQR